MNPRTILIAALAMSGSFVTILAIMGFLLVDTDSRPRPRRVVSVAPPPAERPDGTGRTGQVTGQVRPADTAAGQQTSGGLPDVPDHPVPLSETADPEPGSGAREPAPDVARMAEVAADRLEGVETALNQQVELLKESRDEMVAQFAEHLAALSVVEATELLKPLDDETAALALKRLAPARRNSILRALPQKRRAALEKRLAGAG